MGNRTCALYGRLKKVAVAVANLPWSQRLCYIYYLVTRPKYSHVRWAYYWYSWPTQGCQYTNLPGTNLVSLPQHRLSAPHIFTGWTNIVSHGNCCLNFYPCTIWPFS